MSREAVAQTSALELARRWLAAWRDRIADTVAAVLTLMLGAIALPLIVLESIPALGMLVTPALSGVLLVLIGLVLVPAGRLFSRVILPRRWDELLAEESRKASDARAAGEKTTADPIAEAGREVAAVIDEQHQVVAFRNAIADRVLLWTRWSPGMGVLVMGIGGLMLSLPFLLGSLPLPASVVVAPAMALILLGNAARSPMPTLRQPDDEPEAEEAAEPEAAGPIPLTGDDLLGALRASEAWRDQELRADTLQPAGWVWSDSPQTIERLRARFPRMATPGIWRATGLRRLTRGQDEAVRALLEGERPDAPPTDYVFSGWPGSGRATVANLWTLGSLLHREGAVHCISAENPDRAADHLDQGEDHGSGRTTIDQLQGWIDRIGTPVGRIATAFSDDDTPLDMGASPDMLFTDVQVLSERLLTDVRGDVLRFLLRLRTLIIDHPDRLQRHELAGLRIAIARLRLIAEMHGHHLTVILLLPRLNNSTEFASWLLGSSRIQTVEFRGRYDHVRLLTWLPPIETLEHHATPLTVRADYEAEVRELLAELTVQAQRLGRERHGILRVAVLDHRSLLGPELRRNIWLRCEQALQRDARGGDVAFRHTLHFLSAADLATGEGRAYDILLALGIGPTPDRLVMNLRGALRPGGALILLGDSSPEDLTAIHTLQRGDFDPTDNVDPRSLHSILLPRLSDPVIEHQLAMMFDDFGQMGLPRDRIETLFASESVPPTLDRWLHDGLIERFHAFRPTPGDPRPSRATWLRRTGTARLAERFRMPWGCTTRRTLRIWNDAAAAQGTFASRREVTAFVDADRVFIDLYPGAQLRHNPSSVEVSSAEGDFDEQTDAGHPDHPGRLRLRQPDQESLRLSRRHLRTSLRILSERPLTPVGHAPLAGSTAPGSGPPRSPAAESSTPAGIHPAAGGGPGAKGDSRGATAALAGRLWVEDGALAVRLADEITPWMRNLNAPVRVSSGVWTVRLREAFRDVVATDSRLVEAPAFVSVVRDGASLSGAVPVRAYEAAALHLFFTLEDAEVSEELREAWADRAAWLGLARALSLYLRRRMLLFESEFGVDLVENRAGAEGAAARWRIILRPRHAGQVQAIGLLETLRDQFVRTVLPWIAGRLADCECEDGCPACVGGLGTATRAEVDAGGLDPLRWTAEDMVSRRSTRAIVGALLGR